MRGAAETGREGKAVVVIVAPGTPPPSPRNWEGHSSQACLHENSRRSCCVERMSEIEDMTFARGECEEYPKKNCPLHSRNTILLHKKNVGVQHEDSTRCPHPSLLTAFTITLPSLPVCHWRSAPPLRQFLLPPPPPPPPFYPPPPHPPPLQVHLRLPPPPPLLLPPVAS